MPHFMSSWNSGNVSPTMSWEEEVSLGKDDVLRTVSDHYILGSLTLCL